MSEPFLGQITMFGGNFAPRNWAMCDGSILPINQYTALFSILGTTYGGDGRTTFALPDLRGRAPVHPGRGAGLPAVALGEKKWSRGDESERREHGAARSHAGTGLQHERRLVQRSRG